MLWYDVAGLKSEPGPFLATVNVTRIIAASACRLWIDGVRKLRNPDFGRRLGVPRIGDDLAGCERSICSKKR
jgi:hypothetical protein